MMIRLIIKTLSSFAFKWKFPIYSRSSIDLMLIRGSKISKYICLVYKKEMRMQQITIK
jgi:hypothetical protein